MDQIIIGYPLIIFRGVVQENRWHRHPVVKLIFSCDGILHLKDKTVQHPCGVVVDCNVAHRFESEKVAILVMIDPESPQAKRDINIACGVDHWFQLPPESLLGEIKRFLKGENQSDQINERVKTVLELVEQPGEIPTIKSLADAIYLSESRLQHLFKAEIGISITKYRIFQQLKRVVIDVIQQKRDLTAAAIGAGFSDSAHFSRIFSATFGYPPKKILKNSRNVQVIFLKTH